MDKVTAVNKVRIKHIIVTVITYNQSSQIQTLQWSLTDIYS